MSDNHTHSINPDHSHSFNSTSNNTYIGDFPAMTTHNCCGFGCYCHGLTAVTTTIKTNPACEYCMKPVTHTEKSCPRVKRVSYYDTGAIAEIEFV